MLGRVESLYLSILRIVILALATVALVVTVLALIGAAGPLSRSLGIRSAPTIEGGFLRDYIDARKATAPASTAGDQTPAGSVPAASAVISFPAEIQTAANTFYDYTKGAKTPSVTEWEQFLKDSSGDLPATETDAYLKTVLKASNQLKIATGKKLTTEQVMDYIQFNKQRFQQNAVAVSANSMGDGTKALLALYVAGGAFFFFILIVFVFIFVKIERSLRLVHTVRMESLDA
jgi:hypothetical protein